MLTTVAAVHNTMRTMRSHDEFTLDVDADATETTTDERRKRTKTTHAASRICYDWMIVSGNCHYARDRASFTHYRAIPRRTVIKNNIFNPHEELEVAGVGTVELRVCRTVRDGGASSHVLVLEDVLHIPEAVCNGFNPLLYGSSMSCNMAVCWGDEVGACGESKGGVRVDSGEVLYVEFIDYAAGEKGDF
jgi:hypothetical protein